MLYVRHLRRNHVIAGLRPAATTQKIQCFVVTLVLRTAHKALHAVGPNRGFQPSRVVRGG
jgi:hypothetical protein